MPNCCSGRPVVVSFCCIQVASANLSFFCRNGKRCGVKKIWLCRNSHRFLMQMLSALQTRLLFNANKASLRCKQDFFSTQTSLVWNTNRKSLIFRRALLCARPCVQLHKKSRHYSQRAVPQSLCLTKNPFQTNEEPRGSSSLPVKQSFNLP